MSGGRKASVPLCVCLWEWVCGDIGVWARVFDAEEKGPGEGLSICLLLTQCVFASKRAQRLWSLQGHNTLFLL